MDGDSGLFQVSGICSQQPGILCAVIMCPYFDSHFLKLTLIFPHSFIICLHFTCSCLLSNTYRKKSRKSKEIVFVSLISTILLHLAPDAIFNPSKLWIDMKLNAKKIEEEGGPGAQSAAEDKKKKAAKKGKKNTQTAEEIQAKTVEKIKNDRIYDDVIKVRNKKDSLPGLLRDMKTKEGRLVLMIELLKQAMDSASKDSKKADPMRAEMYDILWGLEALGLNDFCAPPPEKKDLLSKRKDTSLLYDDYSKVKKVYAKAQEIMASEKDMIKMQLVDMCDRLPPLTKFTFGYKLDPWQVRVLRWIDAGKNVIICAPTSSGKTVLSSYAAFPKTKRFRDKTDEEEKAEKLAAQREATRIIQDDASDDEGDGEGDGEDEEASESEEEESDDDEEGVSSSNYFLKATSKVAGMDRKRRLALAAEAVRWNLNRVLFVVPTQPLVWQVGAYFSALLKGEGDRDTKVAIVTDQIVYHPMKRFGLMPQIVVGTPMALESELSKVRGAVGHLETYKEADATKLPGGFDHFDWVVYDEVHALDGGEGAALQRLVRSMTCNFLALSATVGNAEQMRGWFESVRGDQLNVEMLDVSPEEIAAARSGAATKPPAAPVTTPASAAPVPAEKALKVRVQCTFEADKTLDLLSLSTDSTVQDLKDAISSQWAEPGGGESTDMGKEQLQVFLGDPTSTISASASPEEKAKGAVDLAVDDKTLGEYGFIVGTDNTNQVTVYRHVNLLSHQGRFINLQRYVWSKGELKDVNPLAAVETTEELTGGILDKSSLSLTSKDSYKLWLKMSELYPRSAVEHLDPHVFYGKDERITLQRTKQYEDLVKQTCKKLAGEFPAETQELLYHFRLEDADSTDLDLCELVMKLRDNNMTPCLPFHLNSFEAIKLFQQVLAGFESRQKEAHPQFYSEKMKLAQERKSALEAQIKSHGGDNKALEEAARAGDLETGGDTSVDVFAPHPRFMAANVVPLNDDEIRKIADEIERYDGFDKRDGAEIKKKPGENASVLSHSLMRGLRRGIGLFINEVSFPAYRRAVMRLASKGALAVVISDDSLAFGVNMPFRTCIFCGEMYDRVTQESRLTPLMAQQMSGRAGRRGLDTQGNLVYVGSRAKFVRKLMIGEVSNITGRQHEPQYYAMALQGLLAPRHVGWGRSEVIGKQTLQDYVDKGPATSAPSYTFQESLKTLHDLHLVESDKIDSDIFGAAEDYDIDVHQLCMVWELRANPHESVTMGKLFTELLDEIRPISGLISETNKEKGVMITDFLLAILLIIIDRHRCREGQESLQDNPYFKHNEDKTAVLHKWEKLFASVQESLPDSLRDPVGPYEADGKTPTSLDGTLFNCLLERSYCHTLSDNDKQNVKDRLWRLGQVLKVMHNCSWPSNQYYAVIVHAARKLFKSVKFINGELIRGMVDFENVTDVAYETRGGDVKAAAKTAEGLSNKVTVAKVWTDDMPPQEPSKPLKALAWCSAIQRADERLADVSKARKAAITEDDVESIQRAFSSLNLECPKSSDTTKAKEGDKALLSLLATLDDKTTSPEVVGDALNACSAGGILSTNTPQHTLGVFVWFVSVFRPSLLPRSPLYLKAIWEADHAETEDILKWDACDFATFSKYIPEGSSLTEATLASVKQICKPLVTMLEQQSDGEDDEDDDED